MSYENSVQNVNNAYDRMKDFRFEYRVKECFGNVISLILLYCGYSSYRGFQTSDLNQGWAMLVACIFLSLFFGLWYILVATSENYYNNANKHYKSLLQTHEKTYGKDHE